MSYSIIAISISIIIAYLLGSIPTGIWYGVKFHGIDLREHGSGNTGATNTFRVLGKRAGIIVLLVDIIKGLSATMLAMGLLKLGYIYPGELVTFKLLLGLIAVLGHVFSMFLGFKGGKGVATLLGVVLAVEPFAALICMVVFLIVLVASKYVSLSSILGTLSFPLILTLSPRFRTDEPVLIVFGFMLSLLIIITHHKNIKRIIEGSENKTHLINRWK